jgi:hypothetical protein
MDPYIVPYLEYTLSVWEESHTIDEKTLVSQSQSQRTLPIEWPARVSHSLDLAFDEGRVGVGNPIQTNQVSTLGPSSGTLVLNSALYVLILRFIGYLGGIL